MGDGVSGKEAGINSLFVGLGNGGVRRIGGEKSFAARVICTLGDCGDGILYCMVLYGMGNTERERRDTRGRREEGGCVCRGERCSAVLQRKLEVLRSDRV
jgi:hypothetical protein